MKSGPFRPGAGISLFSEVHQPPSVEFHNRRHNLNRFIVARSNVNRKIFAVHATKECEGVKIYLLAFLTSAPDGVERSLTPRRKGSLYSLNMRLGG